MSTRDGGESLACGVGRRTTMAALSGSSHRCGRMLGDSRIRPQRWDQPASSEPVPNSVCIPTAQENRGGARQRWNLRAASSVGRRVPLESTDASQRLRPCGVRALGSAFSKFPATIEQKWHSGGDLGRRTRETLTPDRVVGLDCRHFVGWRVTRTPCTSSPCV